MHKVFLSSTWRDMADRRAAILRAIRVLDGFDVEAMEEFGLSPQPRLEVCLRSSPSDVFFGVLGAAYGSSPSRGRHLTRFAGVIMAGYFQGGYANVAQGIELDASAAAVIGRTALFGGRGSAVGTLLGVLVLAVLDTGLLLLQVSPAVQLAARGAIVIFAVATDLHVRRLAG